MKLDVEAVRACYPALADGYAYLDGAAGTQVPAAVIDAISQAQYRGIGNSGGAFPASQRADAITAASRAAVAALTGGDASGVIFGPSMTALTYRLADALAKDWRPGDEVVVTRLDHDANVRPWVQAAERAGAVVRWAAVDSGTGELPAEQFSELLSDRTRLVAVSAASNVIGTRPDVSAITAMARAAGALSYVDGVHATPHMPVDVHALGADFYATSAYKWSGPHIGTVVADPALLAGLRPDKLVPSPDEVPDRFELGTLPFANLAGVTAAVEHLAGLAGVSGDRTPDEGTDLRERVLASMAAVQQYEQELFGVLLAGLDSMPHVRTYGRAASRTATAFFTVADRTPQQVAEHMASRKINVWHGHNYAWELTGVLGIRDAGSAVRAGLVHYNDSAEVDRLLTAVAELGWAQSARVTLAALGRNSLSVIHCHCQVTNCHQQGGEPMGFLDNITAKLGGSEGHEGGMASLQKMFNSNGGLHGLTTKLTNSGLGQQVQSWVGTGENKPVTGAQVQQAMDPKDLNAMAKQAGMTPEQTSHEVAKALPEMVNQATPQGKMPDSDPFSKGMDAIKHMFNK